MPRLTRTQTARTVLFFGFSALVATAAWAQAPVRVGGDIKEPHKLIDVAPDYPAIAKQARVEGISILEATIGTQGDVTDVRVLRSNSLFDQAAITAVRQWKYQPTLVGGVPTPVLMTITINFVLKGPVPLEVNALLDQARTAREAGRLQEAERYLQDALEQVRNEMKTGVPGGIPGGAVNAAPPTSGGPLRVGGLVKEPQKIKNVPPVYPPDAKNAQVSGVVIIEATIATDGTVRDARVIRSNPLFDQAALDAVKQWVYSPTTLNGVPVEVMMTVVVNFQLK